MKYHACGLMGAHKYLGIFEADTAEDAIKLAWDSPTLTLVLCQHCESQIEPHDINEIIVEPVEDY